MCVIGAVVVEKGSEDKKTARVTRTVLIFNNYN